MKLKAKDITIPAVLTAVAICISILESSLPIIPSIPGGKLGISNVIILIILYRNGACDALIVNLIRAAMVSFLWSGANAFAYSFFGALISSLVMIFLFKILKSKVTPIGLSVAGAFFHNLTQVVIASISLGSASVLGYVVVLSVISIISGFLTGLAAKIFINSNNMEKIYE